MPSSINTTDEKRCHWMVFFQSALVLDVQNLYTKDINTETELKVWYTKEYAFSMGSRPHSKTSTGLEGGEGERGAGRQLRPRFACPQCHARVASSLELDSHVCSAAGVTSFPQTPRTRQTRTSPTPPSGSRRGRPRGDEVVRTRAMQRASQQEPEEESQELAVAGPSTSSGVRTPAQRAHRCTLCEKSFSSPGKLYQHMYSHTGERPFACSECSKAFSSKFKLMRHLLIHSADRKHQCPFCERSFHRKDHLKNHSKVHNPDKKVYRCEKETCRKEYNSYLSYRKHVAVHAAEDGGLDCKICGKNFTNREEILYHLKVHAGSRTVKNPSEKKFQCEHCERRFFTRKDVKRHLVVHTGRRDFLCQFCPQRFGRKDHLVRHIKKSHGGRGRTRRDVPTVTGTSSPQPSTSGMSHSSQQGPVAGPSGLQRRGSRRSNIPRSPPSVQAPAPQQQMLPPPPPLVPAPAPTPVPPQAQPPAEPTEQPHMYPTQPPPPYSYKMYPETSQDDLGIKIEEDDESSVGPSGVDFNQLFMEESSNQGMLDMSLIEEFSEEDGNQLMQLMEQSSSAQVMQQHPIAGPSHSTSMPSSHAPAGIDTQQLQASHTYPTPLPGFQQVFQQPPPPPPPPSQ
ncbi:hypothetical protein B566_EDAN014906 [Ephemera danica]|nr:hypothetical protein B566_EDAN014906 [Ephemera danica]